MADGVSEPATGKQPIHPIHRALAEALGSEVHASALTRVLAGASLTGEQQALIELLLSLDSGSDEQDRDTPVSENPSPSREAEREGSPADPRLTPRQVQDLLVELDGLRLVNDTTAAALGACPICWGGQGDCDECGGKGHAGSRAPDLQLFRELVVPAVRRLRPANGANGQGRIGRLGVDRG